MRDGDVDKDRNNPIRRREERGGGLSKSTFHKPSRPQYTIQNYHLVDTIKTKKLTGGIVLDITIVIALFSEKIYQ